MQNGATLIMVILIGTGLVFITSAIEDLSILDTFQKIIRNEPLGTSTSATTSSTTQKSTLPATTLL